MSAPKTRNKWGFGAKIESTYGTVNAPTATDGVLTLEVPEVDQPQFLNDGDRGVTPGGASRPGVNQSGRWGGVRVSSEWIGGGAAYSASVKPHLDVLKRICGLEATGSFTGGSENWKYAPEAGPASLESATVDAYVGGQLYRLTGCYGTFEITCDGPGVPRWDFDIVGIADVVTDAAILAFSNYPAINNPPPKAENIALTIGTFTGGKVRSFHFVEGREKDQARADLNGVSNQHAGFTPGSRSPTLEVVLERTTLATVAPWHTATTLNPYRLAEDRAASFICSLNVGSVQYKRFKLWSGPIAAAAAQAQLLDVQDTNEGPTKTWTLTIGFRPSTYLAEDEFAIVGD